VSGFRVGRAVSWERVFLVVSWKKIGSFRRDSVGSDKSCSFLGFVSSLGVLICFRRAVNAFSSYDVSCFL
jgi:hypothetical protein